MLHVFYGAKGLHRLRHKCISKTSCYANYVYARPCLPNDIVNCIQEGWLFLALPPLFETRPVTIRHHTSKRKNLTILEQGYCFIIARVACNFIVCKPQDPNGIKWPCLGSPKIPWDSKTKSSQTRNPNGDVGFWMCQPDWTNIGNLARPCPFLDLKSVWLSGKWWFAAVSHVFFCG